MEVSILGALEVPVFGHPSVCNRMYFLGSRVRACARALPRGSPLRILLPGQFARYALGKPGRTGSLHQDMLVKSNRISCSLSQDVLKCFPGYVCFYQDEFIWPQRRRKPAPCGLPAEMTPMQVSRCPPDANRTAPSGAPLPDPYGRAGCGRRVTVPGRRVPVNGRRTPRSTVTSYRGARGCDTVAGCLPLGPGSRGPTRRNRCTGAPQVPVPGPAAEVG